MKKIILTLFTILLLANLIQAGDGLKLPKLTLKENYSPLYPKIKPFGTSTFYGDSSGYFITNAGFKCWGALYTLDSLIVTQNAYFKKDAYTRGKFYLDTNGKFSIYGDAQSFYLKNEKQNGSIYNQIYSGSGSFQWIKDIKVGALAMLHLDTTDGLVIDYGDCIVSDGSRSLITPLVTLDTMTGSSTEGISTLGAGVPTVKIYTTYASDKNIILVTPREAVTGIFYVDAVSNGVSFDVTSTEAGDVEKTFSWFIVKVK